MPDSETLSHTTWDCKYHVVFIPKYRRKALYHELRRHLGEVFRALAEQNLKDARKLCLSFSLLKKQWFTSTT
jgi:REP element-mobilizing transposase RayT